MKNKKAMAATLAVVLIVAIVALVGITIVTTSTITGHASETSNACTSVTDNYVNKFGCCSSDPHPACTGLNVALQSIPCDDPCAPKFLSLDYNIQNQFMNLNKAYLLKDELTNLEKAISYEATVTEIKVDASGYAMEVLLGVKNLNTGEYANIVLSEKNLIDYVNFKDSNIAISMNLNDFKLATKDAVNVAFSLPLKITTEPNCLNVNMGDGKGVILDNSDKKLSVLNADNYKATLNIMSDGGPLNAGIQYLAGKEYTIPDTNIIVSSDLKNVVTDEYANFCFKSTGEDGVIYPGDGKKTLTSGEVYAVVGTDGVKHDFVATGNDGYSTIKIDTYEELIKDGTSIIYKDVKATLISSSPLSVTVSF